MEEDRTLFDGMDVRHESTSLCETVKEIIGIICCFGDDKDFGECDSKTHQGLQLSVHVKKKSEKTKDELDVFTVKVKCNKHVPMMTSLKELRNSKLIDFVGQMQRHEEESHLVLRLPDKDDPGVTRTSVLWISRQENSESPIQIQKETLSKRSSMENEILVVQLRIFMKASSLMRELQCMSRLICCFKMLNPLVGVCLSLEGIDGEELDLRKSEHFRSESLMVSKESKLYNFKGLMTHDAGECDVSLFKMFSAESDEMSHSPLTSVCGLLFIPRFFHNNSYCDKKSTPIAPYSMGCDVKVRQDSRLPQFMADCDTFSLWMCYVLNQDQSHFDSTQNGILDSLKELAQTVFQKLFGTDGQTDTNHQPISCTSHSDYEDSAKRWITDIATSLSGIYIKSTDVSFRANVAQMAPVHTCMIMKDYLQESLETILLTNRGLHATQPLSEHANECKRKEDEWKELPPLSPFLSQEDRAEGNMSPDSLDMSDHEWNQTANEADFAEEYLSKDETRHAIASQPRISDCLHRIESTVENENEVTAESLPDFSNNSVSHQDENVSIPVCVSQRRSQLESAIQTQSPRWLNQSLTKNTSCLPETKCKIFDLETETAAWITCGGGGGGLNQDVNNRIEKMSKFDKTFNKSGMHSLELEPDSNYGNTRSNHEYVKNSPLMKRSITNNDIIDSNIKKVKTDDGLLSMNFSQPLQSSNCPSISRPSTLEMRAPILLKDEPHDGNAEHGRNLNLQRNAVQKSDPRIRDEQTVPVFINNEQIADDWFDEEEFSNWCQDLQN